MILQENWQEMSDTGAEVIPVSTIEQAPERP